MYKKRGQATILILLGIVVVGLVAGVYYSRDYILKSKIERMSEKALVVPSQAESVRDFVMSCIDLAANEATDLAGQRGGYIEISGMPASLNDKFSNNLEVLPGFKIPYWYYKQANNVDKQQILSLEQIEKNIVDYVNEQLRICLGTFEGFKREGYKINPGIIKTATEIQNSKILFRINFPIHMELKGFKFDFEEFYYKLDKPLGELYDTARGIYNYENGKNFLEEKTVNMMVGYEEIPLTGENFECGNIPIWDKNTVIMDFKDILSYNIPVLKIKGSSGEISEELKKYYEVDIGSIGEDVDINFVYSSRWPFSLEVEPEENGILKTESIGDSLGGRIKGILESVVCYNMWHFVYDIKYPVLVILEKDGYSFQFATMVVIDKNEPRQAVIVKPIVIPEPDARFCDNKQYNLEVSVYDEYGIPVNDADVSYKCINHLCKLGKTDGNVFSGLSMPCVGGSIFINKEGYHYGGVQTDVTSDVSVSVSMKQMKEMDVEVEVLRGGAGKLKEGENVYITLTDMEDDYSTSVVYPGNSKIKLIRGNYKVSLFMMKESADKITIPGRAVQSCVDVPKGAVLSGLFGTEKKCVTTNVPSVELDRVVVGAAEYEMSVYDLKDKVIFYVPYSGIPHTLEDLYNLKAETDVKKPTFV